MKLGTYLSTVKDKTDGNINFSDFTIYVNLFTKFKTSNLKEEKIEFLSKENTMLSQIVD